MFDVWPCCASWQYKPHTFTLTPIPRSVSVEEQRSLTLPLLLVQTAITHICKAHTAHNIQVGLCSELYFMELVFYIYSIS